MATEHEKYARNEPEAHKDEKPERIKYYQACNESPKIYKSPVKVGHENNSDRKDQFLISHYNAEQKQHADQYENIDGSIKNQTQNRRDKIAGS